MHSPTATNTIDSYLFQWLQFFRWIHIRGAQHQCRHIHAARWFGLRYSIRRYRIVVRHAWFKWSFWNYFTCVGRIPIDRATIATTNNRTVVVFNFVLCFFFCGRSSSRMNGTEQQTMMWNIKMKWNKKGWNNNYVDGILNILYPIYASVWCINFHR